MPNILITHAAQTMGDVTPVVFRTAAAAAVYIVEHAQRTAILRAWGEAASLSGQSSASHELIFEATDAPPGTYPDVTVLQREKLPVPLLQEIDDAVAGLKAAYAIDKAMGRRPSLPDQDLNPR